MACIPTRRFDSGSVRRIQATPTITYDATADFETLKYEQLEEFQDEVAAIVAERMHEVMQREGRVEWTAKLAIRPDGLEITKKPGAAPELIGFDRISQWKIDQGLFKLGIDDSSGRSSPKTSANGISIPVSACSRVSATHRAANRRSTPSRT